jgi:hypothetical protein
MAQQPPARDDEPEKAGIDAPRSLKEYIKTTVINTLPPLVVYYAIRAFGVTPYLALAGAIIAAVGQGALAMVRKRKFEPLNALVILAAGASLTIAFTTKNPRVVQVTELVPVSLMVWSCTVSGLLRKPASKQVTGVIAAKLADGALPERGWTPQDIQDWHKLHTRLCLWLGLLCGLFPAFAVYLIFTFPVDVSQFLITSIGTADLILCIASAVALLRRFVQQRDQAAAEREGQPAEQVA